MSLNDELKALGYTEGSVTKRLGTTPRHSDKHIAPAFIKESKGETKAHSLDKAPVKPKEVVYNHKDIDELLQDPIEMVNYRPFLLASGLSSEDIVEYLIDNDYMTKHYEVTSKGSEKCLRCITNMKTIVSMRADLAGDIYDYVK